VVAGLVYLKSAPFSDFFRGLPIWFFAGLFGSALALPALFLFRLLNKDLAKSEIPVHLKNLIYAIVGMLLLWVTFFFMNREIFSQLSWDNIAWPLAYSLTLLIGAFIFRLKEENV